MSENLKDLILENTLSELYKINLFSLKSIAQDLFIWDNYSDEEKWKLMNFTKRDTEINKTFTFDGEYNDEVVYGEILRPGVEKIWQAIQKYKKPTEKDVFVDIGSGCGKLLIHLSLISNLKTLIGVEKVELRSLFSKKIKERFLPESKSVFFINKDILQFDISFSTIVFMNDICFSERLQLDIWEKIPQGCHVICSKPMNCKILKDEIILDISWNKRGWKWYYYIK